jgi:sugar phosphate permease
MLRLLCLPMFCSYTCLYLNRGTLTFTAPVMVNDPLLGLTKTDIGAMTSAFPAAYGGRMA